MEEIDKTSKQYEPLSLACSSIYFTIDNLHQIHFLYQFSLQFFLDIFNSLLTDVARDQEKDHAKRLTLITNNLFERSYKRISRGMLHEDKVVLALTLARIYLARFQVCTTRHSSIDPFLTPITNACMASSLFQVAGGKEVNLEKEFNFLLSSDAIEQDADKGETGSGAGESLLFVTRCDQV